MAGVVSNAAFDLDQLGDAPGRPQTVVEAQGFGAALEPSLDALQTLGVQPRRATCTLRLTQCTSTTFFELPSPTAYRLSVDTDLASHLGLCQPLSQQLDRLHSSPLERVEVPFHASWVSHTATIRQSLPNVTIFSKTQ